MSTRRPTAGQFAGVFGAPTSPRRDDDDLAELGAPAPQPTTSATLPPPAEQPGSPRPAPVRRPTRVPATPDGPGEHLDQATRRNLDVEARRFLAVRRRLAERVDDLEVALRAALDAGAAREEVAAVLASLGLPPRDLPPELQKRLRPGRDDGQQR